jgi:hypothetical protein
VVTEHEGEIVELVAELNNMHEMPQAAQELHCRYCTTILHCYRNLIAQIGIA